MNKFEFIKKVYKVDYEMGGRDIESSIDCWGLIVEYYRLVLGITIPSYDHLINYQGSESILGEEVRKISREEFFVEIDKPEENSFAVINMNEQPVHFGLMVSDKDFLSVYENVKVKTENIDKYIRAKLIYAFYKHENQF